MLESVTDSTFKVVAMVGFAVAVIAALLVTQTRHRVSGPGWLVPLVLAVLFALGTAVAIRAEGLAGLLASQTDSLWGMQIWFNLLLSVTACFFLLQGRARSAGMKSEVWVLVVAFTGSLGLLLMLARLLYLEQPDDRQAPRPGKTAP